MLLAIVEGVLHNRWILSSQMTPLWIILDFACGDSLLSPCSVLPPVKLFIQSWTDMQFPKNCHTVIFFCFFLLLFVLCFVPCTLLVLILLHYVSPFYSLAVFWIPNFLVSRLEGEWRLMSWSNWFTITQMGLPLQFDTFSLNNSSQKCCRQRGFETE